MANIELIRYKLFQKRFIDIVQLFSPLNLDRVQEDILYYLICKDGDTNETHSAISIFQKKLADDLKISLSTLYRHLARLNELEYIQTIKNQTDFGIVNTYKVNYKRIDEVLNGRSKCVK